MAVMMSYAAWKRATQARLEAGSRVVSTPRGPVEYSELGAGETVLVLHGRPGGYDQGRFLARRLGEDLAHWVAVSRPGYLRTPLDVGRTPAEQADAFAALLDALGIGRAVVLGLSGGGPSALQFALRHSSRCRGLILVSAITRRRPPRDRSLGHQVYDRLIARSDWGAWLFFRMIARLVGPGAREGLATVLELSESLRGAGRRNDLVQISALPDLPPSGIVVPALILHGAADRIVPLAHAEAAAGVIPGAQLVAIAEGGHDVAFRSPRAVAPEISSFLTNLSTRQ